MKADSKSRTGRIGVAGTHLLFERLGWIFREQTTEDYGIDAHIEVVEDNIATGHLIAVQIKSGDSYFKEKTSDGIVFRGSKKHLKYWQKHSLPVIIVLYDDCDKVAYWQSVNSHTVQETKTAWKLIVPFLQKINSPSLEKIQGFSKKMTAINDYTILSFKDVSHAGAKRYSANVLLSREFAKPDIKGIIRKITTAIKSRDYYRNNQSKLHWQGKDAQVVWLFLYLSLEDVSSANWICRTQWISKHLSAESSPIRVDGENIGDGIIIDWNKGYGEFATILDSQRITKENYLDSMNRIFHHTKLIVNQTIELTNMFKHEQLVETNYLVCMSKLEPEMEKLYSEAIRFGIAPIECSDLSQRFQSLMAISHNITLPFSGQGLEVWAESNRYYLVDQAIKKYEKELLRLEFELEKIH